MVRMDKEYKLVENITLICYSCGVIIACATKFLPFILLTVAAYPISLKVLNKFRVV